MLKVSGRFNQNIYKAGVDYFATLGGSFQHSQSFVN